MRALGWGSCFVFGDFWELLMFMIPNLAFSGEFDL